MSVRCEQEKVNRVLWLNSLPRRFKREILDKLISDDVCLSPSAEYRIFVDFGLTNAPATSFPRLSQHRSSTQSNGQSKTVSPERTSHESTKSPIRVTWRKLDESEVFLKVNSMAKT